MQLVVIIIIIIIAATMYPLGTWFVSGICAWIPCVMKTMMMMMMMMMIIATTTTTTTHYTHRRHASMLPAGFEPTIPVSERAAADLCVRQRDHTNQHYKTLHRQNVD